MAIAVTVLDQTVILNLATFRNLRPSLVHHYPMNYWGETWLFSRQIPLDWIWSNTNLMTPVKTSRILVLFKQLI